MQQKKYAIRFGLGAIKAVGIGIMEKAENERKANGKFKDIFDFAKRMDAKSVNKKSIEALSKAGGFDDIIDNRKQIHDSFDIISSYAIQQEKEANSDQMSFFGDLIAADKSTPELKKTHDWSKEERLQKEFEAFGFFLNQHPLDDKLDGLRKRGCVFSDKIDKDEFEDGMIVKMAAVVATSKHRSGPKGRFAYLTASDPFGIFEIMIFDEALITNARDTLADGSSFVALCLIRKDEGGIRILMREVYKLEDFMKSTEARDKVFEDVKQMPKRRNYKKDDNNQAAAPSVPEVSQPEALKKEIVAQVKIIIEKREPIFEIKSFLLRKGAPANFAKSSQVIISVSGVAVDLGAKYLLDEGDVRKIKGIGGVVDVEVG
jgi:DNA polymerase III alpha subunit